MQARDPKLTQVYLRPDLREHWGNGNPLEQAFGLQGEVFRDMPGRRTLRVEILGRHHFVKLHDGVGWKEVFKNWLQLKWPVIGAQNEYEACRDLAELNIPAPIPVGYAKSAGNIAHQRSFVLCEALTDFETLEDVTNAWFDKPAHWLERRHLLNAVAKFAREFHQAGFVHRDFYLCHLLIKNVDLSQLKTLTCIQLMVLDLHRAQRFNKLPNRWRRRDLAGLLFSALDLGLTQRDIFRFVRLYTNKPLKQVFVEDRAFWQSVLIRAEKLYAKGSKKNLTRGLYKGDL